MGDFVGFLMISGCTTRRFRALVIVWVGVTVKLFVVMDAPCMRPRRRLYDFWTFADVVWHVWIDWWFIPCTFLELVRMFDWYLLFGSLSVFVYLSIVLSSSEFYRRFLWHPHSSSTYTSGIPAFYLERAKQFYSSDRRLWATVHASETLFQKMTSIFLRCFSDFSVILQFHHHSHKDPWDSA